MIAINIQGELGRIFWTNNAGWQRQKNNNNNCYNLAATAKPF
jgi:hypothetical protein